jgi:hypothetical protein
VTDNDHCSMTTPRNLGYLGLLPFFMGAMGPWVFHDALGWLTHGILWYSLAIFSFLCGSIWGLVLQRDVPARRVHLITCKCFLLLGWIAIFLPVPYALGMLIVCYVALYQWERHTHLKHALGPDYLHLRQQLTWPAVACHMLALFNTIRV